MQIVRFFLSKTSRTRQWNLRSQMCVQENIQWSVQKKHGMNNPRTFEKKKMGEKESLAPLATCVNPRMWMMPRHWTFNNPKISVVWNFIYFLENHWQSEYHFFMVCNLQLQTLTSLTLESFLERSMVCDRKRLFCKSTFGKVDSNMPPYRRMTWFCESSGYLHYPHLPGGDNLWSAHFTCRVTHARQAIDFFLYRPQCTVLHISRIWLYDTGCEIHHLFVHWAPPSKGQTWRHLMKPLTAKSCIAAL